MAKLKREDLPIARQIEIAEHDVSNAKAAVEHLPAVEAAARARVEKAQELLRAAEAGLEQVLNVEIPEVKASVGKYEKVLAGLKRRAG